MSFTIDPGRDALVIVDVQNDFCPGGALAVPAGDAVVAVLNRYAERFAGRGAPVFASRDWHPPRTKHFREFGGAWPPHCVQATPGAAFHPDLRLPEGTEVVSKGMGLDHRIGSKFLHAGPGFGGSCFPKDVAALIQTGDRHSSDMQIAKAAAAVNDRQKQAMIAKIKQALGGLKGRTVGILGLSFKPNTNDLREAPALTIIEGLIKEGCTIRAHDPAALEEGVKLLPKITPCADPYEAAKGSDALVIVTEWNQFRNLEFDRLKTLLRQPLLIDLRNVYEPDRVAGMGFRYISVGRPTREPRKS